MFRKMTISAVLLFLIFVFPIQALAVDFSIEEVDIHAYLHEDGTVTVEETFVYDYTNEFNGIIRTLNHPEDTAIRDLSAYENGEMLEIQTEEDIIHYIYRSGDSEKIVIDLTYTIDNALEVYEDRVDFYWAFFDSSNDSAYEDMTITVHPPGEGADPVAIGYDAAEDGETMLDNGAVRFDLGYVDKGENGDIRAAFDRGLFPDMETTASGNAGELIQEEHADREEAAALFTERQSLLADISFYALPLLALIYTILIVNAWLKNRRRKQAAIRKMHRSGTIPETTMSMPATIFYTYYIHIDSDALSAALLDLVQQGKVRQESDNTFRLLRSDVTHDHERILIDWLFHDIGNGDVFNFEDMLTYYEKEGNEAHYQTRFAEWTKAVKEEAASHELNPPSAGFRLGLGLSALLLVFLATFTIVYDLFGVFIGAGVIFLTVGLFALIHQPRTEEGWQLLLDWRAFRKELHDMPLSDWSTIFNQEEQMTAFIFGLATQVKQVKAMAKELPEKLKTGNQSDGDWAGSQLPAFMITGMLISGGFQSTSTVASSHSAGSSGGSIGGGTGVGGGGGGSGGF